jgi:signal transduction histidine kinase
MLGFENDSPKLVAMIGHELRPLMRIVDNQTQGLREYFEDSDKREIPIKFQDRIANRSKAKTVQEVFDGIENNIRKMSKVLDALQSILEAERSKMDFVCVDIFTHVKAEAKQLESVFESIHFICDAILPEDVATVTFPAEISLSHFDLVIRNLVDNAAMHGFADLQEGRVVLLCVSTYVDAGQQSFVTVDCINNGAPLPPNFSMSGFSKLGESFGRNKGTGIGGYLISRIVELHEAKLRTLALEEIDRTVSLISQRQIDQRGLIELGDRPFQVGFRLELPFHIEENEDLD